ncbi:unnamed protein product, partial [Adineta ricciae]
GYGCFKGY